MGTQSTWGTTTDLALYLKYTSIPTKDPSVNQNKPDSDHQSSRWFSPSIFSTQLLPLRPASTSLRTLSLPQDPSSWMSSAPAASPSPPSSRTHKPSSSAPAARPFSANQPEERHVSQRAALSAESRSRPPSIYPFCPFSPLRFRSVIALFHHESLDGWEPGWLSLLICAYLHL